MNQLNDKELRQSLIPFLENQANPPKRILEELPVNNGNAIADIVAIYNEPHCFEIKGDGDKIERILTQGESYNLCFRKITLVTTKKFEKRCLKLAPLFWGIIIAQTTDKGISLKYIRKAQVNPLFDKEVALYALWKDELLHLIEQEKINIKYSEKNKSYMSNLLSKQLSKKKLNEKISFTLHLRQSSFF